MIHSSIAILARNLRYISVMVDMKKLGDDSNFALRSYLREISRFALLDHKQELECSRRIKRGDEGAFVTLVNANLRLVVKIAKSFVCPEMCLMDLIQEGNTGLLRAAEKFDYRRNIRFSTYASYWIKQAIRRVLCSKKRAIRIPYRKEEILNRIQRFSEDFSQKYCRNPSVEELSVHTNMDRTEIVSLIGSAYSTVSLDATINGGGNTLLDTLEDDSYNPDKVLNERALKEEAMRFLSMLREHERRILVYRFAINREKRLSLSSIGKRMGISSESARQIAIRALEKLRKKAKPVRQFIYS